MWIKISNTTKAGFYVYRRKSEPNEWTIILIRGNGDVVLKFGHYPIRYCELPNDSEIAHPKDVLTLVNTEERETNK